MRLCKILAGAVLLIAVIVGIWSAWFLKSHGFSAKARPSRFEAFLARHARRIATEPGAQSLKNPLNATPLAKHRRSPRPFRRPLRDLSCKQREWKYHAQRGAVSPAPDLREPGTQRLSDGEIFYIIKNGVRFTGMPGWGGEDHENWQLVLFIRHLPKLSPEEIALMNEVNHLETEPQK